MKQPKTFSKKKLWLIIPVFFTVMIVLQFFGTQIQNPPVSNPMRAPEEITRILKKSCADCHSNETELKWFDKIAPASWLVAQDVNTARSRFNLSTWDTLSNAAQQGFLWEMINMVTQERMPLPSYLALHPGSRMSAPDLETLKKYVNTLSPPMYNDSTVINQGNKEYQDFRDQIKTPVKGLTASNGVKYVEDFRSWQVISTTNRFDNHSIRIIYGNQIAVKAIQANNIKNFPDGTVLVKVVWNSIESENGDIKPGSLNSVQIMTKDDNKFPETEGWGFAKFNGIKLEPYGATPAFNTTCFNCHKVAKENGYVFNLPLLNKELN